MKKTLAICLIASILATSLTGCGKSDEELKREAEFAAFQQAQVVAAEQAQLEAEAQKEAAEQKAIDDKELVEIVAELKKGDPLVRDAYYGYNEKGDRVLHVIRDNPPQPQQPQYDQSGQPVIINNQPAASSGSSESIWPVVAGIGGGMLLANAINNSGGYDRYRNSHQSYGSRNYDDDYSYRRERTKVVNQYNTTVYTNKRTAQAYKYPNSNTANRVIGEQKASKSVVPSSSTYGNAKQVPGPTSRPLSQPSAKPLTKPDAYKPKVEPAKPATSAAKPASNSYWGSTQKSSPSTSSSSSSSSSSFKASSSKPSSYSRSSSSSSRSSSSRR